MITNPTSYDLSDFLEHIDISKLSLTKPLPDDLDVRGRNDHLFHTLRFWGYKTVHAYESEASWQQEALHKALEINGGITCPLPYKEVRHTAKTTAKWIWKNRHTLCGRIKVMEFTNESPHERMSQGADYTNAIRTAKAIKTLQELVVAYRCSGKLVTPLSLQAASGLNIKTVRKYLPQILSELSLH